MNVSNRSSRWNQFSIVAVLVAVFASVPARANIVYPINTTITSSNPTGNPLQSDNVNGSITTNGTIGVLTPASIVSWNLNLIDLLNSANNFVLTPSNSSLVEDTGSALTATATGLFFDYSGSGEFLIQANSPGAYTGYHYFCFSTGGACLAGETIAPQYIFADGVVGSVTGQQPLNPPSGSVPEPSTYVSIVVGAAALAVGRNRRAAPITASTAI